MNTVSYCSIAWIPLLLKGAFSRTRARRPVETIHRGRDAQDDRRLGAVGRAPHHVRQDRLLPASERRQDEIRVRHSLVGGAHAHTKPGKRLRSQSLDDGQETVVSAVAAPRPQFHPPQLQVQIIAHHQEFLRAGLRRLQEIRDRPTAPIHEGLGPRHDDGVIPDAHAADDRSGFPLLVGPPPPLQDLLDDPEADVVAGRAVGLPPIARGPKDPHLPPSLSAPLSFPSFPSASSFSSSFSSLSPPPPPAP